MRTIALMIDGMRSRHRVREVTARLRDVRGVETVAADPGRSVVRLTGTMTVDDLLGALHGLGYPMQLLDESGDTDGT